MSQVFIGVGSNIDREFHTREAYRLLHQQFNNVVVSSVYECPAVGFEGPGFYNWVARVDTTLSLSAIHQLFKQLEAEYGRKDWHKQNCSRTMDLDLLCFDQCICESPVALPRPEILKRAFVLRPLAEIAPDVCHPVAGKTFLQLWQAFDQSKQLTTPIDFNWSSPQG
ncbi:2-amino-4-hydroxy-6-hydroxymethyldihydropteridine diphosphokinase [Alteromonas lipolytica]|uniref:2-amino-4-hydroxy-6-hydroxymethyldihydropteridine diphosphokinase n=1 Tax=Alteromonas lipolytica TaxID=1856405 RepID=A0A1E8FE18_9ALTE|nr:2-amino-4-hydroxy-6-hydroxymethyldihydropteridine diphosphokinase [Alteromonas lipolytica]OFI33723.1 2-amino-4-hydroxy-6-hydroxymethyldihydropteridine diphosphokinase [Alteromonas lipolytica]GGF69009.1 2-amino-4-hydroxy-6-hydroxymethyldihydropteridine diphosphokinase [Alteromonas lipolytica]